MRPATVSSGASAASMGNTATEKQVVSIFAGTRGYVGAIKIEDVTRFEAGMLSEIRAKGADILKAIRDEKEISAATEGKLKSFLDQFAKTFS